MATVGSYARVHPDESGFRDLAASFIGFGVALHRPAARVICVDRALRILLLCWRDPFDNAVLWEPPGGGIETGESAFDAARRELYEETGILGEWVLPRSISVERDVSWNGQRFVGSETFFLAEVPELVASPQHLVGDEADNLVAHHWFTWPEMCAFDQRIEPPNLREILGNLVPEGPWADPRARA